MCHNSLYKNKAYLELLCNVHGHHFPETDIYLLSLYIVHQLNHQNGDHSLLLMHIIITPYKALLLYKL
jgi:hypothetical protein